MFALSHAARMINQPAGARAYDRSVPDTCRAATGCAYASPDPSWSVSNPLHLHVLRRAAGCICIHRLGPLFRRAASWPKRKDRSSHRNFVQPAQRRARDVVSRRAEAEPAAGRSRLATHMRGLLVLSSGHAAAPALPVRGPGPGGAGTAGGSGVLVRWFLRGGGGRNRRWVDPWGAWVNLQGVRIGAPLLLPLCPRHSKKRSTDRPAPRVRKT